MNFDMRPVPGFEGIYSVTGDGRVWAHEKQRKGRGLHPGRWLRPGHTSRGYLSVVLFHRGKNKSMTVHRIVAMTWIPNSDPTAQTEINHVDGNKANNAAVNLEWCSRSENLLHAYRVGLKKPRQGGALTMAQAREARAMVAAGKKPIRVAEHFLVGRQVIHQIVNNQSYLERNSSCSPS